MQAGIEADIENQLFLSLQREQAGQGAGASTAWRAEPRPQELLQLSWRWRASAQFAERVKTVSNASAASLGAVAGSGPVLPSLLCQLTWDPYFPSPLLLPPRAPPTFPGSIFLTPANVEVFSSTVQRAVLSSGIVACRRR